MSVNSLTSKVAVAAGSLAATYTGSGVSVSNVTGFSVQCNITAGTAPTGTLKLQWCNTGTAADFVDVPNQTASITDNGVTVFNVSSCYVNWIRVVFTRVSGTGTLNATVTRKS